LPVDNDRIHITISKGSIKTNQPKDLKRISILNTKLGKAQLKLEQLKTKMTSEKYQRAPEKAKVKDR
jgi:hypothetical protein